MTQTGDPRLAAWHNYYAIVGSSGGALIGLQFVVITLIASMRRIATAETISSFGSPTVVHLATALILSAAMTAPWPSFLPLSVALAICSLGGLTYGGVVIYRANSQTVYEPVWQDWVWHAVLPCCVYAAVGLAAIFLWTSTEVVLFVVGAAALCLLLIGIHNAWDTVTHVIVTSTQSTAEEGQEKK